MLFRNLFLVSLLMTSAQCFATDGVIRFTGRVFESTCSVQSDKTTTTLVSCSKHVAAGTKVITQVVAPDAHMLVWRANDTTRPDAPVTQWKITEVTYL